MYTHKCKYVYIHIYMCIYEYLCEEYTYIHIYCLFLFGSSSISGFFCQLACSIRSLLILSPRCFSHILRPGSTHMCVYIFICKYLYTSVCMYIHIFTCMYIYMYIYMYTYRQIYLQIHIFTYAHMHSNKCKHANTYRAYLKIVIAFLKIICILRIRQICKWM